jgi:tetratricopeptide (TPR) repeat protein
MAASRQPLAAKNRLDSWKEIAAFFGRDERTVKRWEKERGLPIHRVPGSARGGVFAYSHELAEWLKGSDRELETLEPSQTQVPPSPSPHVGVTRTRIAIWLVPLVVIPGLALFLTFSHRDSRFRQALAASHQPSEQAQDLYLKGRYYWNRRTPDDLNKAVDYFTQAIVNDPNYAQAYVGLADCYNLLREFGAMPSEEAFPRALAAAQRAVELDDSSAEAHNSLAFATFYWEWDAPTAEREHKRALELNPNLVQAHHWYGTFLFAVRRLPEALDQLEQARQLDPASTTILADKAFVLYVAGKKSEGLAMLRQIEATEPALASTHRYLATVFRERKEYANSLAESKQVAALRHDEAGMAVATAGEKGFAAGGLAGMWEAELPVQKEFFERGIGSAYELANTCAATGRNQEALQYLQAAFEKRDMNIIFLRGDAMFRDLHDEPVYQELVARISVNLPR